LIILLEKNGIIIINIIIGIKIEIIFAFKIVVGE
jgi:hypothetical protein